MVSACVSSINATPLFTLYYAIHLSIPMKATFAQSAIGMKIFFTNFNPGHSVISMEAAACIWSVAVAWHGCHRRLSVAEVRAAYGAGQWWGFEALRQQKRCPSPTSSIG